MPLQPYLREMVWGGRRLEGLLGKRLPPDRLIGETWEVSGYPGQESIVASGPLAGRGLGDLLREFGADLVGDDTWQRWGKTFPLLIKFIDAHADLSIQVHPDDDYVRSNGLGRFGKSEAWFVLHSEGGRMALGLTEGVDRGEFSRAIAAGRALDVVEFQDVAPGDVIFVPPGTVHAATPASSSTKCSNRVMSPFASTTTIAPVSTASRGTCTSSRPWMSSTSRGMPTSSVTTTRPRRVRAESPHKAPLCSSTPTTSGSASPLRRQGWWQHTARGTAASPSPSSKGVAAFAAGRRSSPAKPGILCSYRPVASWPSTLTTGRAQPFIFSLHPLRWEFHEICHPRRRHRHAGCGRTAGPANQNSFTTWRHRGRR